MMRRLQNFALRAVELVSWIVVVFVALVATPAVIFVVMRFLESASGILAPGWAGTAVFVAICGLLIAIRLRWRP
jgi:hypothetical protein